MGGAGQAQGAPLWLQVCVRGEQLCFQNHAAMRGSAQGSDQLLTAGTAQSRNVDRSAAQPLPAAVRRAADSVSRHVEGYACDQVTVNDYPPSVGLNPHIDTHSAFAGSSHS